MTRRTRGIWIGFAGVLWALVAAAGEASCQPADPASEAVPLSLEECVSRALESNLDLAVRSLGREIAEEEVLEALGVWKPELLLSVSADRDRTPTASVLEGGAGKTQVTERHFIWDTSLTQRLPAGGWVGLHFGSNRFETDSEYQTINPVYRSSLSLEWTQPLLKGFGWRVSWADAEIAERNMERANAQLEASASLVVAETCARYWSLIFARADLDAKQSAYAQALQIKEITEADMDQGRRPITDVLKAQAEAAERLGEVAAARESVSRAEDHLKLITNLVEDPSLWERSLSPTTPLTCPSQPLDETDCLEQARARRPEYQDAKSEYEALRVRMRVARNDMLPALDLVGRMSLSGIGQRYEDDVSELRTREFNAWDVGVNVSIPLGRSPARSIFQQLRLEEKQAKARWEALDHRISAEVRQATGRTHTRLQQVEAAQQVKQFREKDLDATMVRFRLGMATSELALDAQRKLAEAQSGYVNALVAYNNALIQLEEAKGTLLAKYPIQ